VLVLLTELEGEAVEPFGPGQHRYAWSYESAEAIKRVAKALRDILEPVETPGCDAARGAQVISSSPNVLGERFGEDWEYTP
jgi:hypothetical protein